VISHSDATHLHRVIQQTIKIQMMINASKTQTVRLKKPAGVSRPLFVARQMGWFLVAYAALPVRTQLNVSVHSTAKYSTTIVVIDNVIVVTELLTSRHPT